MGNHEPIDACATREVLLEFASGVLADDRAERIAAHLEHCDSCAEALGALDLTSDPMLAALRQIAGRGTARGEAPEMLVSLILATVPVPLAANDARARSLLLPADTLQDDDQSLPSTEPSDHQRQHGSRESLLELEETIDCYQLISLLGEGGMGTVYKARHLHLNSIVAVKLLSPHRLRSPHAVARFHREMQAIGRLDHPNIVGARDAGRADDVDFLVMDYVDGVDLKTLARQIGAFPMTEACEIIRQAACGLQHAHEHGLVHRDLTPANLMLTSHGQVKILDLGLSMLTLDEDETLSTSEVTLGTVDYMAPEQIRNSHDASPSSDLYSLGCTLYRLLLGQSPYSGPRYNSIAKKLLGHVQAPVPHLIDFLPTIPPVLDKIVHRLMAKAPRDRFQSAAELAAALAPFAAGYDFKRLTAATVALPPKAVPRGAWIRVGKQIALTVSLMLLGCAVTLAIQYLGRRQVEPSSENLPANPSPLDPHSQPSQRDVAKRLLALGARLVVYNDLHKEVEVDNVSNLPDAPFKVFKVVLSHNEKVTDADLDDRFVFSNMRSLNLNFTRISDAGVAHLTNMSSLGSLSLDGTRVTDAGLQAIATDVSLHHLTLGWTPISDEGLGSLKSLKHLSTLALNHSPISGQGLAKLGEMPELTMLYLSGINIRDDELAVLKQFPNLQSLHLDQTDISDAGVTWLITYPKLHTLAVRGTRITDAGLEQLQALPYLRQLCISHEQYSAAAIKRFTDARPDCSLKQK
ncbi:MAG: protein kinase [Planctomycetes bacterium]|nr:protein kinase [Planctomycetota bacterium]